MKDASGTKSASGGQGPGGTKDASGGQGPGGTKGMGDLARTSGITGANAVPPDPARPPLPYPGILGLMLGIFLATLDGQIVSTALPTVVGDLGGLDRLSWVVTAYLLTAAAATPIWGKLGDLYGRKGAYLSSVVIFLAGSVLSGLAQDMNQLIAFRAVQGLGAGGLMVGALSIIGVLVAAEDRGRIQSMIGVLMPVAFVGGPLLGGFLTDHLSWRWAFYVNLPVGAMALLAVGTGIRLRTARTSVRIDFAGAALLTVAILGLTLLSSLGGGSYRWTSPQVLALGAVSAAALAWFVRVERRAAEPVIPPRLFRSRTFAVSQLLSFLVGAVMLAVMIHLPQYLQFVRGASSTTGGLLLLPLMLGMLGAQLATGRYLDRPGARQRRPPVLGGALTLAGALLLLLLGRQTPTALVSALTLVSGVGIGLVMQSTMLSTMTSAAPRDMGAATGTVTLARTIGGSLGVAALGAVYTGRTDAVLAGRLGREAADRLVGGGRLTPALLREVPAAVRTAVQDAVVSGLHGVLVGAALLSAVVLGAAWLLGETRSGPVGGLGPAGGQRAEGEPVGRDRTGAAAE
ncbi:MFS transporter [Kitasatospora herbaricolor]|uniref:DHA2 family efflux MFS transporter permease subunit n=1 Tax=Kitasatospora herbaricolor TaxID=68217 RepID=UPI0017491460|nr:DHA2 family efflux MFS transporter permease subunit [Kitasatospora herbaricolor]MDQ0307511.1 EmrB/QacA subfamily drug resistance transporter [Kitasatospora herbaricolor]GGV16963.1 MFS transporter [Kitasatospora herbaricolor]